MRLLDTGLNAFRLSVLVSFGKDDSLANFCLFEDRRQLQASCIGFLLVGGTVGDIIRLCKFALVI